MIQNSINSALLGQRTLAEQTKARQDRLDKKLTDMIERQDEMDVLFTNTVANIYELITGDKM